MDEREERIAACFMANYRVTVREVVVSLGQAGHSGVTGVEIAMVRERMGIQAFRGPKPSEIVDQRAFDAMCRLVNKPSTNPPVTTLRYRPPAARETLPSPVVLPPCERSPQPSPPPPPAGSVMSLEALAALRAKTVPPLPAFKVEENHYVEVRGIRLGTPVSTRTRFTSSEGADREVEVYLRGQLGQAAFEEGLRAMPIDHATALAEDARQRGYTGVRIDVADNVVILEKKIALGGVRGG